jgi:hypothetical protein
VYLFLLQLLQLALVSLFLLQLLQLAIVSLFLLQLLQLALVSLFLLRLLRLALDRSRGLVGVCEVWWVGGTVMKCGASLPSSNKCWMRPEVKDMDPLPCESQRGKREISERDAREK